MLSLNRFLVPAVVAALLLSFSQAAQAARLGVELQNVPNNGGAVIVSVDPVGPAKDLGLQPGYVILAVGNKPVTNAKVVKDYLADPNLATIDLTVTNGKKTVTVTADVLVVATFTGAANPNAGLTQLKPGSVKIREVGGAKPMIMPKKK